VSEFDDGDALRPKEKQERDDPEPDGYATVGGDGGDDVEVEDGDYEKEHKISASEGADQVRLRGGLGGGGQVQPKAGSSPGVARFGMTNFSHCLHFASTQQGQPKAAVPT